MYGRVLRKLHVTHKQLHLVQCESVSLSVLHIVKCSFDDGGPLVMMTMMLHSSGIGRLAVRGSHVESTRESREFVSAIQGR